MSHILWLFLFTAVYHSISNDLEFNLILIFCVFSRMPKIKKTNIYLLSFSDVRNLSPYVRKVLAMDSKFSINVLGMAPN